MTTESAGGTIEYRVTTVWADDEVTHEAAESEAWALATAKLNNSVFTVFESWVEVRAVGGWGRVT